jgi:hypothetical protein
MDSRSGHARHPDDYYHNAGEYSTLTSDNRQISVVAGTAPDAARVAYVKTVQPSSESPERSSTLRRDNYANLDQDEDDTLNTPTFNGVVESPPSTDDVLIRDQNGDVGEDGAEVRKKKKKKKKKRTSSASAERQPAVDVDNSVTGGGGAADDDLFSNDASYSYQNDNDYNAVDRVAQSERHSHRSPKKHVRKHHHHSAEDREHDLALSEAINAVTDVNPDLAVERIEVDTSGVARSMTSAGPNDASTIEITPTDGIKKKKMRKKKTVDTSQQEMIPA